MSSKSLNNQKLKAVFDTNVYIAALLRPGLAEELVRRGLRGDFVIIICPEIIEELVKKLKNKFRFPTEKIAGYVNLIRDRTKTVKIENKLFVIKKDLDDNKILECAIAGRSDLIISLDKDLLRLKKYQGIAIMHPKTFYWIIPEIK